MKLLLYKTCIGLAFFLTTNSLYAQADGVESQIKSWLASHIQSLAENEVPSKFVRIDLNVRTDEGDFRAEGYDYGLLLADDGTFATILNERLLKKVYRTGFRDLKTTGTTAEYHVMNLRDIVQAFDSHYDLRAKSWNQWKQGPLSEDVRRSPVLDKELSLTTHVIFCSVLGDDATDCLSKLAVGPDSATGSSLFELIKSRVAEITVDSAYLMVSDPSNDLSYCRAEVRILVGLDLPREARDSLTELLTTLDDLVLLNRWSARGFPERGTLENTKKALRSLTNIPWHVPREIVLDSSSFRVLVELRPQLHSEGLLEELLKCNEPTRCVFLYDSWKYEPRVYTVSDVLRYLEVN